MRTLLENCHKNGLDKAFINGVPVGRLEPFALHARIKNELQLSDRDAARIGAYLRGQVPFYAVENILHNLLTKA
jgi:hypothetical protein